MGGNVLDGNNFKVTQVRKSKKIPLPQTKKYKVSTTVLQIYIAESGSLVRLRCDLPGSIAPSTTKFWHETNEITWRKLTADDSTKEQDYGGDKKKTRKGWIHHQGKINTSKRATSSSKTAFQENLTPFAKNGSKSYAT